MTVWYCMAPGGSLRWRKPWSEIEKSWRRYSNRNDAAEHISGFRGELAGSAAENIECLRQRNEPAKWRTY
ncbi:MAG: hypothetical protein M3Y43_00045 [Pseudomonadota bacterium]|nr:hypothetical protein [Pseudomonadota bacterium]